MRRDTIGTMATATALLVTACGGSGTTPAPGEDPFPPPDGTPTLNVSPQAGTTAEQVTLTGSGFPPGSSVPIGFGPPQSEYEIFTRATANAEGRIYAIVGVPDWAQSGRDYLFVAVPERGDEVMAPFTVTGAGDETGEQVRVTGVLTDDGVECQALRGEDGRLYTLAGDTGRFAEGDRVVVEGSVAEMSFCMQGTTITVEEIRSAA